MIQVSTIYKYREWTNPLHVDILKQKRIYLPSPYELNDPFDCRIPISLELLDNDIKIKKYVDNYVIQNFNSLQKRKVDIKKFITLMEVELKDHKADYIKKYNDIFKEKGNLHFGVFCGSRIWDNIQMWTYYSKNHSGFCIGFDQQKLWKFIPNFRAMKVMYRKNFPEIDPFIAYEADVESKEFIYNCFQRSHTKAIGWKYEKEYRIFSIIFPAVFTKENRLIQINDQCFKSLFVGLNFPDKDLPLIIDLANELKIPLFKISLIPNKFKLGRIQIN
jgi:hypothetical protein